jgi:hypothetical protein
MCFQEIPIRRCGEFFKKVNCVLIFKECFVHCACLLINVTVFVLKSVLMVESHIL